MTEYHPIDLLFQEPRIFCVISDDLSYYLNNDEQVIYATYFDNYDKSPLVKILSENKNITDDFRRFIVDALNDNFKRPSKKKSTTHVRDFEIYFQVLKLRLADPTLPIRSNAKRQGAADIVGKKLHLNEFVVINGYQKIQRYLERVEQELKEHYKTVLNHHDQ